MGTKGPLWALDGIYIGENPINFVVIMLFDYIFFFFGALGYN